MKNYQYILWDWDGCLAKTLTIWLEAYKTVFAKYELYPKDREITEKIFGDWNGSKKLGIKDTNRYNQRVIKLVNQKLPHLKLYPFAKEILAKLKSAGKTQALLTSSKRSNLEPALENNRLKKFFAAILTVEDVKKDKPHPEMIKRALLKLDGNGKEAIMIGDSKYDLMAATNAHIDSVLFHPKEHEGFYNLRLLKSYHPTYFIKSLKELPVILL